MNNIILVSGYFHGLKKTKYFERLDKYLNQFDFQLILFSLDKGTLSSECDSIKLPQHLNYRTKLINLFKYFINVHNISNELQIASEVEAKSKGFDLSASLSYIILYSMYMDEILKQINPCLCILWNQFTGKHRAFVQVCKYNNIPNIFAHEGVLPGTIVFEIGGQMGLSWVANENEKFLRIPVNINDLNTSKKYLVKMKNELRTHVPQNTDITISDITKKLRNKNRRIIFYAGQNDYESGLHPDWDPEAKIHSPIFNHTLDALEYLAVLAKMNNWHILFKPHPYVEIHQKDYKGTNSEYIDIVQGANIFECIKESDLTVTIVSQVSYLALIMEKPVLLLGRLQLTGKGCTYEASKLSEVEKKIREALNNNFSKIQKELWQKHVAQLFNNYLFSYDQDIANMIGRDIDKAAGYIMSKCKSHVNAQNNYIEKNDVYLGFNIRNGFVSKICIKIIIFLSSSKRIFRNTTYNLYRRIFIK